MRAATFTREQRRQLDRESARWPTILTPLCDWQNSPGLPPHLIEAWRSQEFLVQVFTERDGILRASVNRASVNSENGRWVDGIAWEELQRIKREIGRGDLDAVEVFPSDRDVVNVANMRHLFILPEPLPFAWRKA